MTRFFVFALLVAVPAVFAGPSAAAQDKPADPPAPAAAPAADAAPPPTTEVAQGSLSVSSMPPGSLHLDGADTGLTTPVVDLPVAPGKHTVKIVGADGREQSTEFDIEAGGSLNLNLNLPEAAPVKAEEPAAVATPEAPVVETPAPWTWMTVAGWSGLGLGTVGLLTGAVVLTTPDDPDQQLGFGLFGLGVGFVVGGGVLLYLDTELADQGAAPVG